MARKKNKDLRAKIVRMKKENEGLTMLQLSTLITQTEGRFVSPQLVNYYLKTE